MKNCKVRVSPDCQGVFRTRLKRPVACFKCRKYLKQIGYNVFKYVVSVKENKMKGDIKSESIEWKNAEEGVMTLITRKEVKDGDKVIGSKDEKYVFNASLEDLKKGKEVFKTRIFENRKKWMEAKTKIDELGDIKPLVDRHKRLMKDIESIRKDQLSNDYLSQMEELQISIDEDEVMLRKREQIIESRPEK